MKPISRVLLPGMVVGLLLCVGHPANAENARPKRRTGPFQQLSYRLVGPAAGGRCTRATGVPGDPLTYYLGAASGGLWKSVDGGLSWKPIFDGQPASSIGSLAVAPSDTRVIYVGTGEANIRGDVVSGDGIYKSINGGKTWKHVWHQDGQIGTLVVHPTNPDIAYAAVLGHAFGPNEERGVYRTVDGGKTWQRVLHKDADTGASDVCLDPSEPKIVFAGLWQARRQPWDMSSGGPGSGLYVSHDGGDTWKHLTGHGLPEGILGKIGVAVAPSDSRRVYALIEAEKGGLYRSDDGGENWWLVNGHRALCQRPWYYSTLTVDPKKPDVVWFPQVQLMKTTDGGRTLHWVPGISHGDSHDVWINPKETRHLIGCNDGGVVISHDGGRSWLAPLLPISQFYHVAADNHVPYRVSGCMQDLSTACGPSNSLRNDGIGAGDWYEVGGGESGYTAPDPADPDIVYANDYGGGISRYDHRTGQARYVGIYPANHAGHAAAEMRYRFSWNAPILVSRYDHKVVYHGANMLFRTDDEGAHWRPISPDLTRNDRSKQKPSGGPIDGDNTSVEYYGTIFALAESPREKGLLWVGTDDGLVHISRDEGKSWDNVTQYMSGLPEWGTICCIEASPFAAGTAYVVVDNHRLDDMRPHLFKTMDFGRSWQNLSERLPQNAYLQVICEDPKRPGLVYAGTERGVLFSTDGGESWQSLQLNLPTAPVRGLQVKDNDLVVGTHGRAIWILDDLTPIRLFTDEIADKDVYLFPVQPAIRWRYRPGRGVNPGQNPPDGAVIDYYLKDPTAGDVVLEVLDEDGRLVRRISSKYELRLPSELTGYPNESTRVWLTTRSGINRAVWDLRYEGADLIKKSVIFGGDPKTGPMAPPGSYTIKLTVGGTTLTRNLTVEPDPRVHIPVAELNEQLHAALKMRDDINRLTRLVAAIGSLRSQLVATSQEFKTDSRAASIVTQAHELLAKLDALEDKLHNRKAQVLYDVVSERGGTRLYSKWSLLFSWLVESDGAPTQGMQEMQQELLGEQTRYEARFKHLLETDLRKLNDAIKRFHSPHARAPRPGSGAPEPATRTGP
jgi:photosystem II stability/assembly factor-like uncharacterized protein